MHAIQISSIFQHKYFKSINPNIIHFISTCPNNIQVQSQNYVSIREINKAIYFPKKQRFHTYSLLFHINAKHNFQQQSSQTKMNKILSGHIFESINFCILAAWTGTSFQWDPINHDTWDIVFYFPLGLNRTAPVLVR